MPQKTRRDKIRIQQLKKRRVFVVRGCAGGKRTEFTFDCNKAPTKNGDIFLDGQVVSHLIRTPEVSMAASNVSAFPVVRKHMVAAQQKMGESKSVIMDGRDIGTVVFPDAELKIYMTADAMVRAERRYKELTAKGDNVTLEEVYENVVSRDKADMSRAISPLRKADDAIVLDNSHMSVEEQMSWFMERYEEALAK